MRIHSLEKPSSDELKPLLVSCNFVPFKEYGVQEDLLVNYITNELSDLISRKGSVLVAEEQGKIIGLLSSEKSDWDSSHFGIDISRITHLYATGDYFESFNVKQKLISHLQTKCLSDLSLHVSMRVHKEDLSSIHALESKSFRLMDVLVTYFFDLRKQNRVKIETQTHVRSFKQEEIPQLAEISRMCFKDNPVATDRFHADPTLSSEKSGELYTKWLIDSCHDLSAAVLVAEVDGKIIGFNICTINKPLADELGIRLGTITLTAVIPSERNKLVATSMLNASLDWFADKVDIVETGGQVSNYAIQRAWTKTGFNIIRSQCTFHWAVLPESL